MNGQPRVYVLFLLILSLTTRTNQSFPCLDWALSNLQAMGLFQLWSRNFHAEHNQETTGSFPITRNEKHIGKSSRHNNAVLLLSEIYGGRKVGFDSSHLIPDHAARRAFLRVINYSLSCNAAIELTRGAQKQLCCLVAEKGQDL